ncbi:MAG: DUF58 domain-containing protein [Candidatus Eremiobacteraeota bacterium]|nr:DUF58 domain-containing protein [Candidatus Eremiobacteraeota bacterium]
MKDTEIFRKIKRIEIRTSRLVEEYFSGQYESVFKGTGMEFSEVREYLPGDDIRAIDWNVTARFGKPFIKKFTEERELTIMLLVDMSGSESFGSLEKTKAEIACEIAAVIAFSAIKNQDKVGLIIFTDGPERYLPPKKGRRYVLRIIREILMYEPRERGTDIEKTLRFLNDVTKRKAVVFLISDFLDDHYKRILQITNKRHDCIAINLRDPREQELPPVGLVEFEDSETGEALIVDTNDKAFREEYERLVRQECESRTKLFKQIGVDCVNIWSHQSYVNPLYTFFKMRARRKR